MSPSGSHTDVVGAPPHFRLLGVRVVLLCPRLLDVVVRLAIVLLTVAQLAPLRVPVLDELLDVVLRVSVGLAPALLDARGALQFLIVLLGYVLSVASGGSQMQCTPPCTINWSWPERGTRRGVAGACRYPQPQGTDRSGK